MELFPPEILEKLKANGRQQQPVRGSSREIDFYPVVKIFNPYGTGTWLLTEVHPVDDDIAYGLCDLGCPEIGYVSRAELICMPHQIGVALERDLHFKPYKPLSQYAADARAFGEIVT